MVEEMNMAIVAAIQEAVSLPMKVNDPTASNSRERQETKYKCFGCSNFQREGRRDCNHCFKCGSTEHSGLDVDKLAERSSRETGKGWPQGTGTNQPK